MPDQPNDNVRHLHLVKPDEDVCCPIEELLATIRDEFCDDYIASFTLKLLDNDIAHLHFQRSTELSVLTVRLDDLNSDDITRIDRIMGAAIRLGFAVDIK